MKIFYQKIISRFPLGHILIAAASIYLFSAMAFRKTSFSSDFIKHVHVAMNRIPEGNGPAHFLFHILVFSFGQIWNGKYPGLTAGVFVLAFAVVAKYSITKKIFLKTLHDSNPNTFSMLFTIEKKSLIASLFALALVFVMSLPSSSDWYDLYLGKAAPNLWHNPTWILALPFAIASHFMICEYFESENPRFLLYAAIPLVLSTLAKPLYWVLLFPSFFVFHLLEKKNPFFNLKQNTLLLGSGAAIVLIQFFLIYLQGGNKSSGVVFHPLALFDQWNLEGFRLFLSATSFPLFLLIFFPKKALQDKQLIFTWIIFVVSLWISHSFSETGKRRHAGNFGWFKRLGAHLLFISSTIFLLRTIVSLNENLFKKIISIGLLILHFGFGLRYYEGFVHAKMDHLGKTKANTHTQ